jgi:UDP-N-acetylmuramyl pentapeptide phosphotransferase/UDP-N-acetylglucosamine-1-phosphate transferase
MTFYSTLALCCFLISLLGTRLTILSLRKRTVLLDIPNLRSNHRAPTPKGGGLAVVTALVICLLVADIDYSIVLSLLLLAAISLLDDIIGVSPIVRLLVQFLAVALALSTFREPLLSVLLPHWLDTVFIAVLWVWFINVFNFMDGIDGLAGIEMFCIGFGLCLPAVLMGHFPNTLAVYSLLAACAAAGFLWWNWHPAKIFLGDVGSIPLGFLLGYLLLLALKQDYGYSAFILPAYYVSDGGITLLSRLWRREKIWVAHSEHYYQRAVRAGRSHAAVTRYVFGLNLLLILLSTLSMLEPQMALFHLSLAYLSVFMVLGFFAHSHPAEDVHGH